MMALDSLLLIGKLSLKNYNFHIRYEDTKIMNCTCMKICGLIQSQNILVDYKL